MSTLKFAAFLGRVAQWEIMLFLSALFIIIAYQLLTRKINTRNLLYGTKRDGTKYFSPERVQMLIFTIAAGMYYLQSVILNAHTGTFPPFPHAMLQMLGASNGVYLAGKSLMTLIIPGLTNQNSQKGS